MTNETSSKKNHTNGREKIILKQNTENEWRAKNIYRNGNNGSVWTRERDFPSLIPAYITASSTLLFFLLRVYCFFFLSVLCRKASFSASVVPRSHFRLLSFAKKENASLRYFNQMFYRTHSIPWIIPYSSQLTHRRASRTLISIHRTHVLVDFPNDVSIFNKRKKRNVLRANRYQHWIKADPTTATSTKEPYENGFLCLFHVPENYLIANGTFLPCSSLFHVRTMKIYKRTHHCRRIYAVLT